MIVKITKWIPLFGISRLSNFVPGNHHRFMMSNDFMHVNALEIFSKTPCCSRSPQSTTIHELCLPLGPQNIPSEFFQSSKDNTGTPCVIFGRFCSTGHQKVNVQYVWSFQVACPAFTLLLFARSSSQKYGYCVSQCTNRVAQKNPDSNISRRIYQFIFANNSNLFELNVSQQPSLFETVFDCNMVPGH